VQNTLGAPGLFFTTIVPTPRNELKIPCRLSVFIVAGTEKLLPRMLIETVGGLPESRSIVHVRD
jgi:hypothetical protein